MKTNTLFITKIYNLKITEDLKNGILIRDAIFLTNNKSVIASLLTKQLHESIGNLEFNAIQESDAIFYKKSDENISFLNQDDLLCDFLSICKIILTDFWLIKDHSINIMLGFIHYPFTTLNSNTVLPFQNHIVHSNWITGSSTNSIAEENLTNFNTDEILQVIKLGESMIVEPISISGLEKSNLRTGIPRITRAHVFLQTARNQNDLGFKLAHYCSSFECLFSTNSSELTHKLSERIAYFLELDPAKRIEIFEDMKAIYSIRSLVTHGSTISKTKYSNISIFSKKADDILRKIFLKIERNECYDKYYRSDNNEKLEKYLTDLTLGYDKYANILI